MWGQSGTSLLNQVRRINLKYSIDDNHFFSGNPYFCAVGLDRFLRVWRIGAGGKKPTHKMYLKSRLNCVVMCKHFDPEKKTEDEKQEKEEETLDDSIEILESDNEKEEEDDVWDNMVVINSSSISGKRKQKSDKISKRTKLK